MPVKLSTHQLFMLIFTFVIGNSILLYIHPVIHAAGQDAWISCLLAVIPALLVTMFAAKAGLYNPDLTFLANCRRLLGKWLGTAVVVVYLVHWVTAVGSILKYASDFIITLLLEQTPNMVFVCTMLLLAVYAVLAGGILSLGRLAEVFGLISVFGLLFLFVMLIPYVQVQNLLPIYADHGWAPIVRAMVFPLAFKAETIWVVAIIPFLKDRDKALRTSVRSVLLIALIGIVTLLFAILVLGPEVASSQLYPTFDMVSLISIMDFLQNLELVLALAWLLSVFIRLALYLFLASHTIADLFRLRRSKRAVWIVAALGLGQAWFALTYKIDVLPILSKAWLTFIFPWTLLIFPTLLFAAGFIRQKLGNRQSGNAAGGNAAGGD